MAISLDALAVALSSPESPKNIFKTSQTSQGAGIHHSLWKAAGWPTAGANPPLFSAGSGYVPTRATTGAIGQVNPAAGANKYLAGMNFNVNTACTLMLYDRLWACSGFSTVSTSAQSITTPGNIPSGRDPFNATAAGYDAEPWIEVYTQTGATGATWTLTGTDSTGTTGRTWTFTHAASAEVVGRMSPMIPNTAIGGCRSPASLTCSVSSGTAGDVGITLLRRIGQLSVTAANLGFTQDAFGTGLPEIYDDACLAMMVLCASAVSGNWQGQISLADLTP